ncbi:fimbrial protein [Salmonella enterica]|nr:fimbrial protein [Salmonella enterica]
MRNKIILAMATAGMMCATSAFAVTTTPVDSVISSGNGDGTFTVTGSIIDAPCTIKSDDQNLNIDLGQVKKTDFSGSDKATPAKLVTIHLENCSFNNVGAQGAATVDYSKVAVYFVNPLAPVNPGDGTLDKGEIRNTATDNPAEGVSIQFLNNSQNPMDLTKTPAEGDNPLVSTNTQNQVTFYARMISPSGTFTTGNVAASGTYALKYF